MPTISESELGPDTPDNRAQAGPGQERNTSTIEGRIQGNLACKLLNFCKIPAQYQGWCRWSHFSLHPSSEVLLKAINQGQGNHIAEEMCHGYERDSACNHIWVAALGRKLGKRMTRVPSFRWPLTYEDVVWGTRDTFATTLPTFLRKWEPQQPWSGDMWVLNFSI